ncbi:MAG: TolC family protein [Deltaproteobacteria bacterium]|nr:TolC family protein [Deltaproteobacteria bacterium]
MIPICETHASGVLAALLLVACAPSFEHYAERSRDHAADRLRVRRSWQPPSVESGETPADVRRLLRRQLTSDDVVRIALLNNRDLVAAFGELGVARGELIEAAALPNPTLEEGVVRLPIQGDEPPHVELAVVMGLTETVLLPLRRSAADAAMGAAALGVTGATLSLAFAARSAFVEYQAAEQALAGHRDVLATAEAALEAATILREAGNVAEIDLLTERAFHEEARIAVSRAETNVHVARERLTVLMGLWGRDTRWRAVPALPSPAPRNREIALAHVETRAIARSLDLEISRLRILAAARRTTYTRVAGLVPDVEVGFGAAHESGEWAVGPAFRVTLPLLDQGRGRSIAASAVLDRLRAGHVALGVRIRSIARLSRARLEGARDRAIQYRDVVVPLRRRIVAERLLDFNAMQIGVFELLDAQRSLVEAEARAVQELRDYWIARIELEQLLAGRIPEPEPRGSSSDTGGASAERRGH